LHHYRPDLVVLAYGTNESDSQVRRFHLGRRDEGGVKRLQAALPETAILLMSPMDRGERNDRGEIETIQALPRLVKIEAQWPMKLVWHSSTPSRPWAAQGSSRRA
jgi:hypothetical protein